MRWKFTGEDGNSVVDFGLTNRVIEPILPSKVFGIVAEEIGLFVLGVVFGFVLFENNLINISGKEEVELIFVLLAEA